MSTAKAAKVAKVEVPPRYKLVEQPGELRAKWRTGSFGIAGFMIFFLCGWSLGCYLITRAAIEHPEFRNIAGAAAFCIGWLFAFMVLTWMLFGRERITLNADGLTLVQGAIFRRRSFVPLGELVGFGAAMEDATVSSGNGPNKTRKLEIRCVGRPHRCGEGLPNKDRNALSGKLRTLLASLQKATSADEMYPPVEKRTLFRRRPGGESLSGMVIRTTNDPPIAKPSDSRTRLREDFDRVRFVTRGRFHLGSVIGSALLAGFWCGITGIFVYNLWWGGSNQPQGLDWFTTFLFLIPFQLIGLLFLLLVVMVALDPLRAWFTSFTPSEIVDGFGWLGLGRYRRYGLGRLERFEIRQVPYFVPRFPAKLSMATLWSPEGCPTYSLVPIESGGLELCFIEGLTFGEACWMADVLIRRSDLNWAN